LRTSIKVYRKFVFLVLINKIAPDSPTYINASLSLEGYFVTV